MQIKMQINEADLKELIRQSIEEKMQVDVKLEDITIEVKSLQNYRSEWEVAHFRATYLADTPAV